MLRWLLYFVDLGFSIYRWMIIARVLITWIPNVDYYHPLVRFIHNWTEPILAPFRRVLPPMGGFDLSPILVFVVLEFIRGAILRAPFLF